MALGRSARKRPTTRLEVTTVEGSGAESSDPVLHWVAAGTGGAGLVVLAGWLLLTLPVVIAWLATSGYSLAQALGVGTQLWLLSHGAGATIDGLTITLVPLGVTALLGISLAGVAGFAAKQLTLSLVTRDEELSLVGRRKVAVQAGLLVGLSYAALVTAVGFFGSAPAQTARALFGSALLGVVSAMAGSARQVRYRPSASWPSWARAVPRAVLSAVLVMTVAAAAVLATGLAVHTEQVAGLETRLGLGVLGTVLLLVIDLAYLPTMLAWAASYALGAGFSMGGATVVSPGLTSLAMMPGLPVLGALPKEGPGSALSLLWLVSGLVAGVVAAATIVRARRRARFDETALVGGLAGVFAGLVVTAVAALSRGDLGNANLAGVGPRLESLAVMATTLMGLSGMVTGLVLGLLRSRGAGPAGEDDDEPTQRIAGPAVLDADDEPTQQIEHEAGSRVP